MGAPGCPELACCTASIAKARIALAICWVFAMSGDSGGVIRENQHFSEPSYPRLTDLILARRELAVWAEKASLCGAAVPKKA
jgi:hypothetical protein